MDNQDIISNMLSNMISQCIVERENNWKQLPKEQQDALNEILEAVHTINENRKKIAPEFQKQAQEALILKAAAEFGWEIQ